MSVLWIKLKRNSAKLNFIYVLTLSSIVIILLTIHNLINDYNPSFRLEFKWANWRERKVWPEDEECKNFTTRLARKGDLPMMALVSYPGSGNTWIRYLIEGAGGVFTGSVYGDMSIFNAGHWGELRNFTDGSTFLQKTHHRAIYKKEHLNYTMKWRKNNVQQFNGRAVLVIRNPFDAILSYYNFKRTQSHTKKLDIKEFLTQEFKLFAFVGITRWYEIISDWLTYGSEIHLIFYEELKEQPVGVVAELLSTLGLDLDSRRVSCLKKYTSGKFLRVKHNTESPYTEDLLSIFRTVISKAAEMIEAKTGRKLPTQKYNFYAE